MLLPVCHGIIERLHVSVKSRDNAHGFLPQHDWFGPYCPPPVLALPGGA
jgi:hypothetical protein